MKFPVISTVLPFLLNSCLCFQFKIEHISPDLNKEKTVVIFAFSGLRWDSMDLFKMENLKTLSEGGMHARRKIDAFQSESLPAFMTMSTGRYPETHGLVSNRMKDLSSGEIFDVTSKDPKWWNAAEPIWITNEKRNGSSSALCFWPGFDIEFDGKHPSHKCPLEDDKNNYMNPFHELTTKGEIPGKVMSIETRLQYVKKWLSMKLEHRPNLIGVYFEEPLNTALKFGFNNSLPQLVEVFKVIDKIIEDFVAFLKAKQLFDKVNFIVTGESGVTNIKDGKDIYLDDYVDKDLYDVIDNGPITSLSPKDGNTDEVLKKLSGAHPHMQVFNSSSIPDNFRYKYENRTMPIILVVDEHFRINPSRQGVDPYKALMGYDGKFPSSHSLFIAHGPAFKKGSHVPAIGNVDIYQLLCKALKLGPLKHDGNVTMVEKTIQKRDKWYEYIAKKIVTTKQGLTASIIIALLLLFLTIYLIIYAIHKTFNLCQKTTKIKVPANPVKLIKNNNKNKKDGGQHLLSDDEEMSSDLSGSDAEFELKITK